MRPPATCETTQECEQAQRRQAIDLPPRQGVRAAHQRGLRRGVRRLRGSERDRLRLPGAAHRRRRELRPADPQRREARAQRARQRGRAARRQQRRPAPAGGDGVLPRPRRAGRQPYRAAKHLVDDVQVPAILGPAFSGVAINTAKQITIPSKVLLVSASATSPLITDLDDDGLVWRTCPSDALQSDPAGRAGAGGRARDPRRAAAHAHRSDPAWR